MSCGWYFLLRNRTSQVAGSGRTNSIAPSATTADDDYWRPLADFAFGYDVDGKRTRINATEYGYDSLGRLETVAPWRAPGWRYCFDADSNRTATITPASGSCTSGTVGTSYTYGAAPVDGLVSVTSGGTTTGYGYDHGSNGDGNVVARGSDSFAWDGYGRLERATVGGKSVCYVYGPDGSLKTRVYDATGSSGCSTATATTNYLLGDRYETDSAGATTAAYLEGPAGNLARWDGPAGSSQQSFLYYNGHGDLAAEAGANGALAAGYDYDPFGALTDAPASDATSHRYVAAWDKQYDPTTSLVLMGARPYDPNLGRFLAADPIDGGSLNTYGYAGQDPINNYDLTGTMWADVGAAGQPGCTVKTGCPETVHSLPDGGPVCHGACKTVANVGQAVVGDAEVVGLTIGDCLGFKKTCSQRVVFELASINETTMAGVALTVGGIGIGLTCAAETVEFAVGPIVCRAVGTGISAGGVLLLRGVHTEIQHLPRARHRGGR